MKPSLKKSVILGHVNYTGDEISGNNRLILVTAAGTIIGDPIEESDSLAENDIDNFMAKLVNTLAKNYREKNEIPEETALSGNDGCFALKNVMIRSGAGTVNLPYLTVFYDQIIGVTFGKI